jgi:hypothetical protein
VTVILHMAATTRFTEHIQVGLLVTLFFLVPRHWRQSLFSRVAAAAAAAVVVVARDSWPSK